MSSSIEEYFEPPEWATKDEVIKAAKHYVNYWRIEAKSAHARANDAEGRIADLKAEVERLKAEIASDMATHRTNTSMWKAQVAKLTADYRDLEAENARLRKAGDRMAAALNGDYNHELDCVKEWNAAKDGKTAE